MSVDTSSLIALISSRICHDLASPIQALTTALDVLETETSADMRETAISLLRESTALATAKIEFLRATFGSLTAGEGTLSLGVLHETVKKYLENLKPELIWEVNSDEVSRPMGRVLMNLILAAIDSMPRGGQLKISDNLSNGTYELLVSASGPRVSLKASMRDALSGLSPEGGYDSRSIQPYVAFFTASQQKIELAARESEEAVILIARQKQ